MRCGCGALIGRQMIYQKINFLQQQQQQPPHSSGDDGTRISSPLIVIMLLLHLMLGSVTPHPAVSAAVQVPTLSNNQHWSHMSHLPSLQDLGLVAPCLRNGSPLAPKRILAKNEHGIL